KACSVSELDGARSRGGEPYAHLGEEIVEQSDLVLAIWDGLPPRGPGGTGDVVQRALDRGVPVAVLPRSGPAKLEWQAKSEQAIDTLLKAALLPPENPKDPPHRYFQNAPRDQRWRAASVRRYERTILVGARLPPEHHTSAAPDSPPATAN